MGMKKAEDWDNSTELPKKPRVSSSAAVQAGVMSCYQYDKGLKICIEPE
jgi:hypothetical protein